MTGDGPLRPLVRTQTPNQTNPGTTTSKKQARCTPHRVKDSEQSTAPVFQVGHRPQSLKFLDLTEEDLLALFNSLPRRCMVLLEDIDTAGLSRPGGKVANHPNTEDEDEGEEGEEREEGKKKGLSLSGLLNAIDGVATHEGRVLIMTTNHRERLDEALTRPGRLDVLVAFTNAGKEQVREQFKRMYNAGQKPSRGEKPSQIAAEELNQTAAEFADKIPDKAFSPAKVQGFLLMRKNDPRKALAEVGAWVEQ